MNGMVANKRKSCREKTSLRGPSPANGPSPSTAPRMQRVAITSIEVETPVVPKRKADQSKSGTSEYSSTGRFAAPAATKVKYPRTRSPNVRATASIQYENDLPSVFTHPKIAGVTVSNARASVKKLILHSIQLLGPCASAPSTAAGTGARTTATSR